MAKSKEIINGWTNLLNKKKHVEEIASKRKEICSNCEHNSKFYKTLRFDEHCMECGCTLSAKVRSLESECPIGKWLAVKIDNNNGKDT